MTGSCFAQMTRPILGALFLTATFLAPSCSPVADPSVIHAPAAFVMPKDAPALPNVLLIGDSISIHYAEKVRKKLKGEADVCHIRSNGQSSDFGLKHLDTWLGDGKWDVIHFNWGLWDIYRRQPTPKERSRCDKDGRTLSIPPGQYRRNLERIVARLKETGADLIWCTTTPVPEGEPDRRPGDEITYNRIAAEIMAKHGIATNDLHAHALGKLPGIAMKKGDIHYTPGGYAYLAGKIADSVSEQLRKQPRG